ncbi:tyrosine kinase receptor Cad96Ca [Anabas testudineus]|uniref:Protein kinase domain-containing protein n=1 Tax=Anabas testudineus TaxID=64144 RepID=A0A3Q1INZ2_ANATE|nr:tyrosine kinase receptor Cad96Ca [Anabas testudineus]XP_026196296.1 tyrosine kinase receptor Cad96Ca [Anabas testudineus]
MSDNAAYRNAFFVLAGILCTTILLFIVLVIVCLRKYRSMTHIIHELQKSKWPSVPVPQAGPAVQEEMEEVAEVPPCIPLRQTSVVKFPSRRLWKDREQGPSFTKSDLNLLQLIKAGKEGVYYQARMNKGTCKGHSMFTCKISKEGVRAKNLDTEISIMRKLVQHKNILQLLDWNTTQEPYMLIMEYVSYGTLRTYLQTNRSHLKDNPELQSLLTIASYHIALAMQHLCSKMIIHCDLALRNIMVSKFPWEVKVAEFGLARDSTRLTSRRSSRWRNPRQRVPLRWYPPEYFKNNYYSFKGDVWAFGIVLWEMQTFGTLPYPHLETSEAVVYHICIGHKNPNPEGCRQEIVHIMKDCWQEPYNLRPSFTDLVRMLEDIMESDADYVDVESEPVVKDEAENHETKSLQASCLNTFTEASD